MSIINKVYEKIRVKIYQYLFIKNFQTYDEADIFASSYKLIREGKGINAGLFEKEYSKSSNL